jgi:hypothetical protein
MVRDAYFFSYLDYATSTVCSRKTPVIAGHVGDRYQSPAVPGSPGNVLPEFGNDQGVRAGDEHIFVAIDPLACREDRAELPFRYRVDEDDTGRGTGKRAELLADAKRGFVFRQCDKDEVRVRKPVQTLYRPSHHGTPGHGDERLWQNSLRALKTGTATRHRHDDFHRARASRSSSSSVTSAQFVKRMPRSSR